VIRDPLHRYIGFSIQPCNDLTPAKPLSHKRNSKDFDRLKPRAALSSHDEATKDSWPHDRVRVERERVGAIDDQRCGRDVSVSDLFQVV
jgi:hypothetical protein